MHVGQNNRWYDKYPDFSLLLHKLGNLKIQERAKIVFGIKDLIKNYDADLIDKYVFEYTMPLKRRWYDRSPYSWLVMSALKYADADLINNVIYYLKEKL